MSEQFQLGKGAQLAIKAALTMLGIDGKVVEMHVERIGQIMLHIATRQDEIHRLAIENNRLLKHLSGEKDNAPSGQQCLEFGDHRRDQQPS